MRHISRGSDLLLRAALPQVHPPASAHVVPHSSSSPLTPTFCSRCGIVWDIYFRLRSADLSRAWCHALFKEKQWELGGNECAAVSHQSFCLRLTDDCHPRSQQSVSRTDDHINFRRWQMSHFEKVQRGGLSLFFFFPFLQKPKTLRFWSIIYCFLL